MSKKYIIWLIVGTIVSGVIGRIVGFWESDLCRGMCYYAKNKFACYEKCESINNIREEVIRFIVYYLILFSVIKIFIWFKGERKRSKRMRSN